MSDYIGQAIAVWAKTELQSLVERVFNCGIFEAHDDEAVCLEGFPRTIQLDKHSCGIQVMRAVLAYYEKDVEFFDITWNVEDPEGLDTDVIRETLALEYLKCRAIRGWTRLEKAIDKGRPVIVCLDDAEHWAVVFGYSPSHIYLMDPSPVRLVGCRVTVDAFEERWDEWGLVVREG